MQLQLTQDEFDAMNANASEFHEVCELHSCGQLIEVGFYDTTKSNGGDIITGYVVSTRTVDIPEDVCHVFDHVAQRHYEALSPTATRVTIEHAQTMRMVDMVFFDDISDAMRYATKKVTKLSVDRCYH